jgi:hypothetical protein
MCRFPDWRIAKRKINKFGSTNRSVKREGERDRKKTFLIAIKARNRRKRGGFWGVPLPPPLFPSFFCKKRKKSGNRRGH